MKHLDALGLEVQIGLTYGYSCRANGFVNVFVGTVVALNEESVSLEVKARGRALYAHPVEREAIGKKIVSARANSLFPLLTTEVKWEK